MGDAAWTRKRTLDQLCKTYKVDWYRCPVDRATLRELARRSDVHCGLRDDAPDFRKCVRTITLDPFSSFLYWRMNCHLEHHMFASIPCYNLKKLHQACAGDMPTPRTLVGAWREMRQTLHKQQEEPTYQYDTPVPTPAEGAPAEPAPEAASMGEIVPAELRRRLELDGAVDPGAAGGVGIDRRRDGTSL